MFLYLKLEIPEGRICGLLGKNGAGKSTLLYLICGLLKAQRGTITFDGQDTSKRKADTLSELFIVPEEFELPAISLDEYVRITAPFYPKFDRALMEECLHEFNLPEQMHLDQLPLGQKKKVFMCFALATNVKLLLMDEPTNGMDIPSKSQFRKVISRCMTDERTLIISTHLVKDIELLLDHIIVIDNSRVMLNADTTTITEKLAFKLVGSHDVPESALYSKPNVMGQGVVLPNTHGEDTQIDLELLFNATITNPESIQRIFHS